MIFFTSFFPPFFFFQFFFLHLFFPFSLLFHFPLVFYQAFPHHSGYINGCGYGFGQNTALLFFFGGGGGGDNPACQLDVETEGRTQRARVLIDPGANLSFATNHIVSQL